MPVHPSRISTPMALTPNSQQETPAASPPTKLPKKVGSRTILRAIIPGIGKSSKPAPDSSFVPPPLAMECVVYPVSGFECIELAPSSCHTSLTEDQLFPPTIAHIQPLHVRKASTLDGAASQTGDALKGSDKKRAARVISRAPQKPLPAVPSDSVPLSDDSSSKTVRFDADPVTGPVPVNDPPTEEDTSTETQPRSKPSKLTLRRSRGTGDVRIIIGPPLESYIKVVYSLGGMHLHKVCREAHDFAKRVQISATESAMVPDAIKASPSYRAARGNMDTSIEVFKAWMGTFRAEVPISRPTSRDSEKARADRELEVSRAEKEKGIMVRDCRALIDDIWNDYLTILGTLQREMKAYKLRGGEVEEQALDPEEEELIKEVKAVRKSGGDIIKAMLSIYKKFTLPSGSLSTLLKKKRPVDDDQTSLGTGTLVSIPTTGLTSSTTLSPSSVDLPGDLSLDGGKFLTLRASLILLDSFCPGIQSLSDAETPAQKPSSVWDKDMTLPAVMKHLTNPAEAHDENIHILLDTFFVFLHQMSEPDRLLEVLVDRFNEVPPRNFSGERLAKWEALHSHIKYRVVKLITSWVQYFWYEPRDEAIRQPLYKFLHQAIPEPDNSLVSIAIAETLKQIQKLDKSPVPGRFKEVFKNPTGAEEYGPTDFDNLAAIVRMQGRPTVVDISIFCTNGGIEELARALTLIESQFFTSFLPSDVRTWVAGKGSPQMNAWTVFTNSLTLWVAKSILKQSTAVRRANVIELWIQVAARCLQIHNYSSAHSITLSVQMSCITRLKGTFKLVQSNSRDIHAALYEYFAGKNDNFKSYREDLRAPHPSVPLPFVIKGDIMKLKETYPLPNKSVFEPISKQDEPVIGLTFYRQMRRAVRDVELCYQPYKIPKVELIYDWAIVNSQEYAGLDYEVTMKSLYALSESHEPAPSAAAEFRGSWLTEEERARLEVCRP